MGKWEMVRLGDIATFITKGATPTTIGFKFEKTGVNFIKIESITETGRFIRKKFEHISSCCNEKMKRSVLRENDILFSIAGALGRTAIVNRSLLPANINQALAIIRIPQDKMNSRYVMLVLRSPFIYRQFQKKKQGVAQLNLSLRDISDLQVPLPHIYIQKYIADVLDKVQEIIDCHQKQLEELDNLVKAIFYDMFGDPVVNDKKWKLLQLCELGEFGRGVSKYRPRNAPELLGGDYPFIQTGDIANADLYIEKFSQTYSEVGLSQSKMWEKGTLCITIAANIAKTAILKMNACFPDSVVGFNAKVKTNNIFMHYWFGFFQMILEAQAPESAQKNINIKILNELRVINPPVVLQNKFAEIAKKIEEQKSIAKQAIAESQNLFNSLMNKFFE